MKDDLTWLQHETELDRRINRAWQCVKDTEHNTPLDEIDVSYGFITALTEARDDGKISPELLSQLIDRSAELAADSAVAREEHGAKGNERRTDNGE